MIEFYALWIFMLFLFGFIWAGIGAWMAGEKNRDKLSWGIICFLFGLFGLILLAIAGKKEPEIIKRTVRRKK